MKNLEKMKRKKNWKPLKTPEIPWKTLKTLKTLENLENPWKIMKTLEKPWETLKPNNFCKRFFWFEPMSRLWPNECVLWPNERIFFSFHNIFFIVVYSWTTFVKEFFWLEAPFRLWRNEFFLICDEMNDQFVTKWLHLFCLLVTFLSSFDLAEQLLQKNFIDWKYGLYCDEMNVWKI